MYDQTTDGHGCMIMTTDGHGCMTMTTDGHGCIVMGILLIFKHSCRGTEAGSWDTFKHFSHTLDNKIKAL